jgi:thiamine biosynthesis lipoprotein
MTTIAAHRRVVACMGTVFSFDVRPPGVAERAVEDAVSWLGWVDATFSTYRPGSDISRLARGELSLDKCAPEVGEILERCEHLAVETSGFFSMYAGGSLDPSGLVKGWAIERASDILLAAGSTSHCVNGGGDVQCVGDAHPGQPWRVGIAHPLQPGVLAGVAVGTGLAVATSGTAERGAHVLDPHTRRPPDGLASVTIVAPRLARADAYATAAFAMGAAAHDWLEGLPEHHGFVVATDGNTWSTSGWQMATTGWRRSRCQ